MISKEQIRCKNKNSTKNMHMPFTQIHLLLIFYPIYLIICAVSVTSTPATYLCIS